MPEASRLEVDEDRAFQERWWHFERVAWIAMLLIIVAALAGATGRGGPLAHSVAHGPSGSIDYPRIARWQAAEQMTVRISSGEGAKAALELDRAFARTFTIEDIEPQPSASQATARGHRFEFDLHGEAGERLIVLHLRADRPAWPRRVAARIGDDPPMAMRLIVLP